MLPPSTRTTRLSWPRCCEAFSFDQLKSHESFTGWWVEGGVDGGDPASVPRRTGQAGGQGAEGYCPAGLWNQVCAGTQLAVKPRRAVWPPGLRVLVWSEALSGKLREGLCMRRQLQPLCHSDRQMSDTPEVTLGVSGRAYPRASLGPSPLQLGAPWETPRTMLGASMSGCSGICGHTPRIASLVWEGWAPRGEGSVGSTAGTRGQRKGVGASEAPSVNGTIGL